MGEFIGTALVIVLGEGVVANVLLNKTKGNNSGLIVIAFGWAVAVFVGVYASATASGAHLNPAVTIALAIRDGVWDNVAIYLGAQMLGAITGAIIAWIIYKQHFDQTSDANLKLAVFCTGPAIRSPLYNLITETVATFVFIFSIFCMSYPKAEVKLGTLDALPVALLVLGIGLSLGGPTGYAINPARDLGPRIAHFILPIPGKRDSDWGYAWIPVVGPILGGILAALVFKMI